MKCQGAVDVGGARTSVGARAVEEALVINVTLLKARRVHAVSGVTMPTPPNVLEQLSDIRATTSASWCGTTRRTYHNALDADIEQMSVGIRVAAREVGARNVMDTWVDMVLVACAVMEATLKNARGRPFFIPVITNAFW